MTIACHLVLFCLFIKSLLKSHWTPDTLAGSMPHGHSKIPPIRQLHNAVTFAAVLYAASCMECPSATAALIESVLLGYRGCHLPMLSAGLLPHRTPANPRAHKTAFHHSRNGQMPQTPNTVHSSNICSYADSHSLPLQSWRFHIARNQLLVRFPPLSLIHI